MPREGWEYPRARGSSPHWIHPHSVVPGLGSSGSATAICSLHFLKASLFLWEQVIVRTLPPLSSTKIIKSAVAEASARCPILCQMCCKSYPVSTIFSSYEGFAQIFIIPDEEKEAPEWSKTCMTINWQARLLHQFCYSKVIILVSKTLWNVTS